MVWLLFFLGRVGSCPVGSGQVMCAGGCGIVAARDGKTLGRTRPPLRKWPIPCGKFFLGRVGSGPVGSGHVRHSPAQGNDLTRVKGIWAPKRLFALTAGAEPCPNFHF